MSNMRLKTSSGRINIEVTDIDSQLMKVRVEQGKDRYAMISTVLR